MFDNPIKKLLLKTQGKSARVLNKIPTTVQLKLARRLGFPQQFSQLHPFLQVMLTVQHKQNQVNLFTADYRADRQHFDQQIRALISKPTAIKLVENLKLALPSMTVAARRYHPQPNKALPTLIFYHGGGFVIGNLDTHDEACRVIAHTANIQVISIDYPLAPEHSPHVITQVCIEAYQYIFARQKEFNIADHRLAVGGDSAGGNLATVVAQALQDSEQAPNAQLLLYPTVDLKSRHLSFYKFSKGLIINENDIKHVTEHYIKRHKVAIDNPIVSPTYGKLEHVAPAFIVTAGFDLLNDEAQIYVAKLQAAGIAVEHRDMADMTHGFIQFTPIFDKAHQYTVKIAEEFRQFWDLQK